MAGKPEQRGAPRHPLKRLVLWGSGGLVAAAVIFAAVMLLGVPFREWSQALTRYEQSVDAQNEALASLQEATAAFESAQDELHAQIEAGGLILELSGELIPADAQAALKTLVDEASPALVRVAGPEGAGRLDDPRASNASELDAATSNVQRGTRGVEEAAARLGKLIDSTVHARETLGGGFAELADAVSERGAAMLSGRSDASPEALAALSAALDLIAGAEGEELVGALSRGADAASDVVRTSNAVRIDDPKSFLVVVNKKRPLKPQSFVPELVQVNVPHLYTPLLRPEAAGPLVELFEAFHAETGERLRLQNSYRSYQTQVNTYNYHVSTKGQAGADRTSARPGHSEHQTGLALDVDGVGYGCSIQQCFGDLVHGQWLAKNAWRFGWIIRYPDGFEHITGYHWEPWHLRYVGVAVSTEMHNKGIATLEEYFGLDPAPNY